MTCYLPHHCIRHHIHELARDISGQSLIDQSIESPPTLLLESRIYMRCPAGRIGTSILRRRSQLGDDRIGILNCLERLLGLEVLRQLRRTVWPVCIQESGEARREDWVVEDETKVVGRVESFGETFGGPADGLGRRRTEIEAVAGDAGSSSSLHGE